MERELWSPNYTKIYKFRQQILFEFEKDPSKIASSKIYYKNNPIDFINHWCDTYDPRRATSGEITLIPFQMFERQKDLVRFIREMLTNSKNGLIEKSRDMGATWLCCAFSVWLWLFTDGASIGWYSRKAQLVDRSHDPDTIFEKMRMLIRGLPAGIKPRGLNPDIHMTLMKIINPENNSQITGESGSNVGRGGRKMIVFKDESAHYEHAPKIEAALSSTSDVHIDISSVNGLGNIFHQKREAGKEWTLGSSIKVKNKVNVFIMDWSDHPLKTQEWYNNKKEEAVNNGLSHMFAQEIDRNYSASVINTIIDAEWVKSSIDAHKKLNFKKSSYWSAGLDVADGGEDANSLAIINGQVLVDLQNWHDRDTGVSARRVVNFCSNDELNIKDIKIQYDCIGIGAGVKAEANRLEDEGELPKNMKFIAWNAGASPLDKDKPIIEGDNESPLNGDFYANLKAQSWWRLRLRFEKTHKMVKGLATYPEEELISIASKINNLRTLQKELSQPTASNGQQMKLIVNKTPDGTRSPNLADALIMAFNPINNNNKTLVSTMIKPRQLKRY